MGSLGYSSKYKSYILFLNVSFVLVVCVFGVIQLKNSVDVRVLTSVYNDQSDCKGLERLDSFKDKCFYLKQNNNKNNPCVSQGYINYLYLFYCDFERFPFLGYCVLLLWLLVLFYLLGNTASEYFCSSLESLSKLLNLSPTLAGVTLLSLGNGAPDVFSSLVSFMGSGTSDIGFNTVLGGASFVTCVVCGVISVLVNGRGIQISRSGFVRDVCFFLLVLGCFMVILVYKQINLWGALGFLFMYTVYVVVVYLMDVYGGSNDVKVSGIENSSGNGDLIVPILEKGDADSMEEGVLEDENELEMKNCCFCLRLPVPCVMLLYVLEMPLYIPRRLTIPVVYEKRWSKPTAVVSVVLAPILLAALCDSQMEVRDSAASIRVYGIGCSVGVILGVFAYMTTEKSNPPRKCLFPWLAGGFIMSVTWSYIIAQELVALLVSLGYMLGISPSILGLTILAWGNSIGDLIANTTMALNGGPEGAQVAISGCYAGPIFNILFGMGLSLVGATWSKYPSPLIVPEDPYMLETLGFLAAGLIWALLVLPLNKMKLNGVLAGGLLAVYLLSMFLRLIQNPWTTNMK